MPYALFEDNERLTRSFPTRQEVWDAAERAGLVVPGPDGVKILDDNYEIKPCENPPMKSRIPVPTSSCLEVLPRRSGAEFQRPTAAARPSDYNKGFSDHNKG